MLWLEAKHLAAGTHFSNMIACSHSCGKSFVGGTRDPITSRYLSCLGMRGLRFRTNGKGPTISDEPLSRNALADDRAIPRGPDAGRCRCSQSAECLLYWRSRWRGLEVHRLWTHMGADLRWPAVAIDWRDRGFALEPRNYLCGQRGRFAAARS